MSDVMNPTGFLTRAMALFMVPMTKALGPEETDPPEGGGEDGGGGA